MSAAVNQLRMFAQALLSVCDENDAAIKHVIEQNKTIKELAEKVAALEKEIEDMPTRCPNCDWRSA